MINTPKRTNKSAWQANGRSFCLSFAYKRKQTLNFRPVKGLVLYSLPIMALLLMFLGSAANASDTAKPYHIPAQPLSSALLQFAEDSKLELIVKSDKLRGYHSGELEGKLTSEQALAKLLQGSGMTYRFVDANTVTIDAASNNLIKTASAEQVGEQQTNSDGQMMPKVTVEADAETDPYDPTNTSDPYNKSYAVANSMTATKTDTPVMQTPTSIQVIPQAIMRDQQVIRVEDALRNVSGVSSTGGFGELYDGFTIRGFFTDNTIYRNGIRSQFGSFETANVEQIDVVKGPAAMLYGRIEPGGFFNVVTKKPLDQPYYSLQQQFGSYDLYRTTIDVTGPITDDHSLLYRVNLAYQDRNSFRDIVSNERFFIAPTLTWRPSDNDEIRISFEFRDETLVDDYGIPARGTQPAAIPFNRFLGDIGQQTRKEEFLTELYASHAFNDNWKINGQFTFKDYDYDYRDIFHSPIADRNNNGTNADDSLLDRFFYSTDELYDVYNTSLWLSGKFDLFGTSHETTLGGDYYFFELAGPSFNGQATSLDIFNPEYGANDLSFRPNPDFNGLTRQQWYGLYFQDHITLFDKLHILGGGRYDWAQNQSAGTAGTPITKADITKQQTTAFSPRVGILYQPWDWLSLYANWTESFGLNNGRSSTGLPLSPETATQFEGGLKFAFFDGRLNSSLAYYDITKNNISVPVRPGVSETIGQANSSGFEWDINGQLTDKLNLIASYAYTDARFTRDDDGSLVGNRLFNVPRNSGSVWLKYDLTNNFSIGSGVYIVDQREGNKENTFQLPGYVRWDAMAAYRFDIKDAKLTAQVNVNNILDKSYFKSALGFADSALPGDPISVLGSLKLEY